MLHDLDSDTGLQAPNYSGIIPSVAHAQGHHHITERLYRVPDGVLQPELHSPSAMPLAQVAHDQLRAHVLGDYYPCLGARAAFAHGSYRFGFYRDLGRAASARAHAVDLRRFVDEYHQMGDFATFVALFKNPQVTTEARFEKLLWKHLQLLHQRDGLVWDAHYEPDPEDPHFAFSFAGCAMFVVGMHAGASRFSRRLAFPGLIFNPEAQIRRLKEQGIFPKFADQVRARDTRYQGTTNPSIPTTAASIESEARVYSGKAHPPGTAAACPFHPRPEVVESHHRSDETHPSS
ncbi:MAG TPA: guanitoxin biosynthesis heme-dependent pre-guanitoxin N-hydroxylase GntA [Candidatus Xenobia bacterium]|jgi:hypothetical protein